MKRRGFTLTELMIVVAIVGLLAALGLYGLRRYMLASSTSEAVAVLAGMRAAEAQLMREGSRTPGVVQAGNYAGCSDTAVETGGAPIDSAWFYPRTLAQLTTNGAQKVAWDQAGVSALEDCHRELGFHGKSDAVVRFSYAATAGPSGTQMADPANPSFTKPFPVKLQPEPWYVLVAAADRDQDGLHARLLTTSAASEIHMEQDNE